MYLLLLTLIYLAFISLGLPDSLIGSAWPIMRVQLDASLDFAGYVTMSITGMTIVSTLFASKIIWRFKTGPVTVVSIFLTAVAMFGMSTVTDKYQMFLWAVPYGLGAGAIDTGLNNYVATHYSSKYMSWMHCFWGVGASISPVIMSRFIADGSNWQGGFACVSVIQIIIGVILLATLPVWKNDANRNSESDEKPPMGLRETLKVDGVIFVIIAFITYCTCETTAGLWASSYFAEGLGTEASLAARFASLFYLGITAGRFANGFVSNRFGDRKMILTGATVMTLGIVMMIVPFARQSLPLAGIVVMGIGCAPVFPSLIHATPDNFGKENSPSVISIQLTASYVGSAIMPWLFGVVARNINIRLYPYYLLAAAAIMTASVRALYKRRNRQLLED